MLVPDPLEKLLARDDSAIGTEQDLQDGELLWVEHELPARPRDFSSPRVESQISAGQHRRK